MSGPLRSVAAVVVVVVLLGGCSGNYRPKTIPITGRVLIDGQPPGEMGKIHFTPTHAAEGYVKRPAMGAFNVDGVYHVMSWTPDDGLVPGRYIVNVMPGNPNKTKIAKHYNDGGTSGLELDVSADEASIEYNIELKSE
jgi:hypothetical protein